MKRHLIGLAVFALIFSCVAIAANIGERLASLGLVPNEAIKVDQRDEPRTVQPSDALVVTLRSIYCDDSTGEFVADLKFTWNRSSPPPVFVSIGIGLTSSEKPNEREIIHYGLLKDVFVSGNSASQKVTWRNPLGWQGLRASDQNFYAHAIVFDEIEDEATELVIREYNYLPGSVPLLVKHRESK
jgi:hypothetical protein